MVKLRLREHESISDAVKRFRKLVEHAGIKKRCGDANTTKSRATSDVGHVAGLSVGPASCGCRPGPDMKSRWAADGFGTRALLSDEPPMRL